MSACDVVIVNFNDGLFLKDAVATALQSAAVRHVFVIDNASTDQSLHTLCSIWDDRLSVIRNATNAGFAAGCNIGLTRTTAEHVLLLNPDCRVLDGAIERLLEVLVSSERVGMVGPLLLNPDGSEQAGDAVRSQRPGLRLCAPSASPAYAGSSQAHFPTSCCIRSRCQRRRSTLRQFPAPA